MPFVKRDSVGRIIAASNAPTNEASEELTVDSPELRAFIEELAGEKGIFEYGEVK